MHRIKVSIEREWMMLKCRHFPRVTGRTVRALSWGIFNRLDIFTHTFALLLVVATTDRHRSCAKLLTPCILPAWLI